MPSRKPRLSRLREMRAKNSSRAKNEHPIPFSGKFNRSFFEGPDSTLRGQVREPAPFTSTYHDHMLPIRVALAQKNGLTPKEYHALVTELSAEANRYHSMPLSKDGEPLLRTNSVTREVDIVGVKRLRGRPAYFREIKNWGSKIIQVRAAMKEMIRQYPGIDILRQLEEHHSLSDAQIVKMARSKTFALPKKDVRRLIDDFAKLELAEHELISNIQHATASARSPREKRKN